MLLHARLQLEQARFLFGLGKYEQIPRLTQAAITLAAACQAREIEAQAHLFQGYVPLYQGEWHLARARFERALSLAQEGLKSASSADGALQRVRLQMLAANSLNSLAMVSKRLGYPDQAEQYLKDSLQIAREADDLAGQSRALNGLGMMVLRQGDFAEALACHREALHCTRACGDRRIEGALSNNLGNVYLRLGIYDKAIANYEHALNIHSQIGARQKEITARFNLGLCHHYLGEHDAARSHTQQALQIAQEVGDRRAQGFAWMGIGHVLLRSGSLDNARKAYQESVALRRESGQAHLTVEPLEGLARIALARGETVQSLDYVNIILEVMGDCTNQDGLIDPACVCLTCFQVLQATEDPRGPEILRRGHETLQERAAKISDDELRRSFLENVGSHRELVRWYDEFELEGGVEIGDWRPGIRKPGISD